jgi:hypothetical protein
LWTHYGADEVLLELAAQFDPFNLVEQSDGGRPSAELIAQSEAAIALYRARMDELEREHKQRVSLDLVSRAGQVATRVRGLTDASRILVTYHDVDEPLTELEGYVNDAVLAVDRAIQNQIDIERGK